MTSSTLKRGGCGRRGKSAKSGLLAPASHKATGGTRPKRATCFERFTTATQTAVQADPSINYMIPLYDTEYPLVAAGLRAANAQDRVKVVTMAGTSVVKFLADPASSLLVDVGAWVENLAWSEFDAAARLWAGQKNTMALRNPRVAYRVFNRTNAKTLNMNAPDTWYGNLSISDHYKKQWMIK